MKKLKKKKMKSKNGNIYLGLSIFCTIGTIVMPFAEGDSSSKFLGTAFYFVFALLFLKLYRKKKVKAHISGNIISLKNNSPVEYVPNESIKTNDFHTNPNESHEDEGVSEIPFNADYKKTNMLHYFSRKKARPILDNTRSYSMAFQDILGDSHPKKAFQSYIDEGLITIADQHSVLMTLSKDDLVDICRSFGLPVTGNKKNLVDRILRVQDYQFTTDRYLQYDKYYVLSEKGEKFIEDNEDYIYLYSDYHLDKNRYFEIRKQLKSENIKPSFNQISLIMLKELIQKCFKEEQFGNAELYLKSAHQCSIELGDSEGSLYYLLLAFILLLSGLDNYGRVHSTDNIKQRFKQYSSLTDYNINAIEERANTILHKLNLPYQKYSDELILIFITSYYRTGRVDFDKYKRFERKPKFRTEYGDYWKDPYSILY